MGMKIVKKYKLYLPALEDEDDYLNSMKKALITSDYKKGLLDNIEEFKAYKKFMSENIVPVSLPSTRIYKFRFNYQLINNVWREIEIFGDQKLDRLARSVINKMGWYNDHLHSFFFGDKGGKAGSSYWYTSYEICCAVSEDCEFPKLHGDKVLVASIDYSKNPRLGFVFDFGDDHRFMMEYKGFREADKNDIRGDFPKLTDQRGIAPEQYPKYL